MEVAPHRVDDRLLVRGATREDAHPIARILKDGADDGLVARSDEIDPAAVSRQIEAARAAGNSLYLVAAIPQQSPQQEDDDDLVIGLALLEGAPLMRLHDVARLTMAIAPAYRGQGVGRALMKYAMQRADESDRIRKIELLTRANNDRAIHLYKSLGFVEEGRLRARLKLAEGSYLDDVCMARFKP